MFDFLYHGVILGSTYEEAKDAFRSEDEMMSRFWLQIVCYFLISIGFCTVWAMGFGSHGAKCGAIYGFFVGLIGTGGILINFVYVPIPDQFAVPWAIGGILSAILAGVVVALVYKPKSGNAAAAAAD
ncbi:MAG: hypothetical protein HKN23_01225 [Verrucomicrobiales bacterium]|nr:hypothetical protein [Verrucomicrobiales bacterium]